MTAEDAGELTIGLPRTSTRDPDATHLALETWLTTVLPDGAAPRIIELDAPSTNGMSSETVLFTASWTEADRVEDHPLVARIAPDPANVPVFPEYDLDRQARTMQVVREQCPEVPVPRVLWSEPDPSVVGAPFFVMERIEGVVPPDILPYNFMSWVTDATPEQRQRMQEGTVSALARLHSIDRPEEQFAFLRGATESQTALERHVDEQRAYYDWVVADGRRSPLIEAAFVWLDTHWPEVEGPPVLSWGDARIGNVLYRDFAPVAVLDWEMAALGPRELDVGWLVTLHVFFEDVARSYGLPGLPDLLRRDDVVAAYASATGDRLHDLEWYCVYASTRHAVIMSRIGRRGVHFGEAEMPADIDDLIPHRSMLEQMLAR